MAQRRRFGSVRKLPSGRWQARYWDSADRRVTAPETFPTKADAQRWLSAVETDMGRGDWHDPRAGAIPFGEWTEQWLATKAPKLAASTVDLYGYLLRRHILPQFATADIGRITVRDVQAWVAGLHQSDLSPNTVAKAYRLFSGIMDGAVEARMIARTPCRLKGAGTERHDEMRIATPEQVAAIAKAVPALGGARVHRRLLRSPVGRARRAASMRCGSGDGDDLGHTKTG
jgi:hypothetical protein